MHESPGERDGYLNYLADIVQSMLAERVPEKFGISPRILKARSDGRAGKIFYALMRRLREVKVDGGAHEILDIGSSINVSDEHRATLTPIIQEEGRVSIAAKDHLQYPSSWGILELRKAIANVLERRGSPKLDPALEVMVTGGTIKAMEAVMTGLDIDHIVLPDLSPTHAFNLANAHGKGIITVPSGKEPKGFFELDGLQRALDERGLVDPTRTLLGLTVPSSQAGKLPSKDWIDSIIRWAADNAMPMFVDTYDFSSCFGEHKGEPGRSFLSHPGAMETGVEAITTAKELGLPGIRIGGLAGNQDIINAVRLSASSRLDMLPVDHQRIAARALMEIDTGSVGEEVSDKLEQHVLPAFQKLNWPVEMPDGGLDLLVPIPPGFQDLPESEDKALFASLSLLVEYGVGLFPISECGPGEKNKWLRVVLKQGDHRIAHALERMNKEGFDWNTFQPRADIVKTLSDLV